MQPASVFFLPFKDAGEAACLSSQIRRMDSAGMVLEPASTPKILQIHLWPMDSYLGLLLSKPLSARLKHAPPSLPNTAEQTGLFCSPALKAAPSRNPWRGARRGPQSYDRGGIGGGSACPCGEMRRRPRRGPSSPCAQRGRPAETLPPSFLPGDSPLPLRAAKATASSKTSKRGQRGFSAISGQGEDAASGAYTGPSGNRSSLRRREGGEGREGRAG